MTPSPYRSADDRFPYLAHLKVRDAEFDFMMVSERSENWYGKGESHCEYMELIKPGMLVVDAGANEGYTSILAALAVGRTGHVIAFEPAPHNQGPLLINVAINQMVSRVTLHPCALADRTGSIRFSGEAPEIEKASDSPSPPYVPAVALDDYQLWALDVLKLDLEGYEIKALSGAKATIKKYRPAILVELHLDRTGGPDMRDYGDNPDDLMNFCDAFNYQILRDGQPAKPFTSGVVVLKPC